MKGRDGSSGQAWRRMGFSVAVAGTLWICGCSGKPTSKPAGPAHGIPTPLGLPSSSVAAIASAPPDTLGLKRFAPLLAEPELKKAADAVERMEYLAAALELEAVLAHRQLSAEELPRWRYLQGKLREQAGDGLGAAAAFDAAAQSDWPLRPYAAQGAARWLVRLGRYSDALERLRKIPLGLPITNEARLLTADAAFSLGDAALAIAVWRDHLSGPSPSEAASIRLRLAEALIRAAGEKSIAVPPRGTVPDDGGGPDGGGPDGGGPDGGGPDGAPSSPTGVAPALLENSLAREAISLARRVRLESAGGAAGTRAERLEQAAVALLPERERAGAARLSVEDRRLQVEGWVEARLYSQAVDAADVLLTELPKAQRHQRVGCDVGFQRGRALAGNRQWGKAADQLAELADHCTREAPERRARILYLAGTYHTSDGRHMQAVRYYERLEQEVPGDRLADDARLKAALSYFEQGVEARFTELLNRMPDDYPNGDMVQDGMFRLALRRMEKSDWSGAASVLDRAASLVGRRDSARGTEYSGRERYFRARAWMHTGEVERGLAELERIIQELPLSYYMIHAYSRLIQVDRERAVRARNAGVEASKNTPFAIQPRPEFESPGFIRARELLRLGETELGRKEIDALDVARRGAAPQILWGVALFYAQAGATKLSHDITRGLLTDWLQHWPAGDWVQAWQLAFPRPYLALVERETRKNEIPEYLAYAVMREESSFDAQAVSPADAYGLMQLIPSTAKLYGKPVGLPWTPAALKKPSVNIALGCRALADLSQTFDSNPLLAIPGYNAGPRAPRRWVRERPQLDLDLWIELIPYRETHRYMKRVLAARAAYSFLYHPDEAERGLVLPLTVMPQ